MNKSRFATDLIFEENKMTVFLEGGRELSVPLDWFLSLRNVTKKQLNNWRFIGNGQGVHWENLDEDISIEKLLD